MSLLRQANALQDHAALYTAFIKNDKNAFKALLNQHANFTNLNKNGLTVIHQIIETIFKKLECVKVFTGKLENDFVNSVLDAHVKFENFTNPCDSNGISHFHVACMSNHKKAVMFFIKNGVSIDYPVKNNSPIFPGYTPLHFAVRYCCLEVVEILFSMYGANVNLKDARGMTPLQILIKQKMEIMIQGERSQKFIEQNYLHEMIINLLIKSTVNDNGLGIDDSGLSTFHIISTMCALQNDPYHKKLEKLLMNRIDINHAVKINSPICPGFTALHFAAYCNLNTFKFLLTFSQINRETKHINGISLLDMKIDHYEYKDLCDILDKLTSLWKFIILSDAKTSLDFVISSLCNLNLRHQLTRNINADLCIPLDSPLWPGSTLLHLSVILLKDANESEKFCQILLDKGVDVTTTDAQGQTPIHLAFRKQKKTLVKLMMKYHHKVVNPVDEDGLSHLHIACTIDDKSLIVKLLSTGTNVINSVYAGNSFSMIHENSTPLHIAINNGHIGNVQLLLERGANLYAKDINNATPLNWVLEMDASKTESICKILVSNLDYALHNNFKTNNNCLNLLHIACCTNNVHTVAKLLDFKKCIDEAHIYKQPMQIKNKKISQYDLKAQSIFSQYTQFTPLHFAASRNCKNVVDLLIRRNANLCLEKTKYFKLIGLNRYIECLKETVSTTEDNHCILERLKNFNLTPLHIACFILDVDKVKHLLDQSVDVNAQIKFNSPLWPNLTPLHLLMTRNFSRKMRNNIDNKIEDIFQLLLSERANVTLVDTEQNSPLHLAYKQFCQDNVDSRLVSLLLNCHSDFSINPVNKEGISHFYIASALSDFDMVKNFLENGVDVDELMTEVFVNVYPTPLLIATKGWPKVHDGTLSNTLETVSLLLDHGANRHVRTYQGDAVLHLAAQTKSSSCRENLFERLINCGCDVNALNIYGATAFEVMLQEDVSDREFQLFLREIEYINVFNPISEAGLMAMIFSNGTCSMIMLLDMIRSTPHFAKTDDMGRTIIHNIVSISKTYDLGDDEFVEFIEDFMNIVGCDIDDQDKSGRTALHYAVKFNNTQALCALLAVEADIDIVDENGKTALHVAAEFGNQKAVQELIKVGADISLLDSKQKSAFDYSLTETDLNQTTRILFVEIEKLKLSGSIDRNSRLNSKVCHISQKDYNKVLFKHQLEKTKSIKIGPLSLTLYDCFSKINIMVDPYKSQIECRVINEFFNSNLNKHFRSNFSEMMSIIKLLQRKVLKMLKLVDQTRDSLNIITGIELPELCFQAIFKYLDEKSVKKLIASTEDQSNK